MKVPEGNISLEAMQDRLRQMRVLRAGYSGRRVDDTSFDVSAYNSDGSLNGNDPSAKSRTLSDMVRSSFEQTPRDWP